MGNEVPPVVARRRQIVTDAYCRRCGYNLRGVEVDEADTSLCPECAARCTAYYLLEKPPKPRINAAQWSVAVTIAAIAAFILGYSLLTVGGLKQTAALFVGLPAIVAIIITLTPRAATATGMAVKGITIGLLVSGIFLGERIVCVLMMGPIFYAIGIGIGLIVDFARRRSDRSRVSNIRLRCWIAAPVVLLSLEGVSPGLSFPRHTTVTRTAIIDAPAADVVAALASTPRFDEPLPFYLRLGFPRPVHCRGSGLRVGDERIIRFVTLDHACGDLHLRIVESDESRVVFDAVSDTSKISGWMGWKQIEVTWVAIDDVRTQVTWRIDYERRLDPAWYFAPWQRYAVGLSAKYLIEAVATPRED